jgi:DNA invertase Pin-like site-specific DNA recombinase
MQFENKTKELRRVMHTKILELLLDNSLTLEEIARRCGCTTSTVWTTAKKNGIVRSKNHKAPNTDPEQGVTNGDNHDGQQ